MRLSTAAIGALLLADLTTAVPFAERRHLARERRIGRRSSLRVFQSTPPLAKEFIDLKDTVAVATSGTTDPNWAVSRRDCTRDALFE